MNRRTLLSGAVAASGAALLAPLERLFADVGADVPPARRRLLQVNAYAADAETPLDALTTYLTPNDLFFVRHHWVPQLPDMATWKLTVDGDVSRPLELTLADLKKLPKASAASVLQCAGNGRGLFKPYIAGVQWKYGAVGNAHWTGVRVKDLLAKAGLKGGAKHLHTFGSDKPPEKVPPFHRSVEIEKVLEDGLLAYEMNGEPLPDVHGAPVRLIVPGWAGDHWMKWLVRLSPQPEAQKGFYMDVAYRYPKKPGEPGIAFKPDEMSPVTELPVKSSITTYPAKAKAGAPAVVSGFAFSGAGEIAKVDVSDDDGATWKAAVLGKDHARYAWRLWSHTFMPKAAGRVRLLARATDSRGAVQPREAVWNQSGYFHNGWQAVEIEVVEVTA
jgi:DMSO/TMAO reductase YedYZ molybdopterin-dependent catalytic subunit